jgi:superfamily II DNA or RNA helicase
MSVTVACEEVQRFFLNSAESDLSITIEPPKQAKKRKWTPAGRTVPCFAYSKKSTTEITTVSVPFAYGVERLGVGARHERSWYEPIAKSMAFSGDLYEEQQAVVDESIAALNRTGSVLVSAYPGFGKCLGRGTGVLMFNGVVKNVEDVCVGDYLCGDDSTPRLVASLARGREEMVRVTSSTGESFVCNRSHILSLKLVDFYKIEEIHRRFYLTFLDAATLCISEKTFSEMRDCKSYIENDLVDVLDLSVDAFLALPDDTRGKLFLFKAAVNSFGSCSLGLPCVNPPPSASRRHQQYTDLCRRYGRHIDNCILFRKPKPEDRDSIESLGKLLFLARSLGIYAMTGGSEFGSFEEMYGGEYELVLCPNRRPVFTFTLEFLAVDDYFGFTIDGRASNRRFLLADFTVTHNTVVFTKLASRISARVFFTTCRPMLCDQAISSVRKFLPDVATQFLYPDEKKTSAVEADADVLAANAQNLPKLVERFPELRRRACVLVVDEAHLLITEHLVQALLCLQPRYVIALTATPYRYDELNGAIPFFFGSRVIQRTLHRHHSVIVVDTGRVPKPSLNVHGELNWTQMISDQAEDEARNDLIARIATHHASTRFLILCKRTEQCRVVATMLRTKGTSSTVFTGAEKTFDRSARVLVATIQKCGVGFDYPDLDGLLLACDVTQYFLQILGRVFRRLDVTPLVVDLVDRHPVFQKHHRERRRVCEETGGDFTLRSPAFYL